MTDWFTGDIDVNGINIHYYRTGGDKPALVLCHGVTDNGLSWKRIACELEQEYDVIMYDQRGHGRSEAPLVGYGFEEHAEDLVGLITALNLESPHLFGHSGGAVAASLVAATYPDLPASLVLEDPSWGTGWGDWEATKTGIQQWFLKIVAMTRDDLLAYCGKSYPHWPEEETEIWVSSKMQVNPQVVQGFEQPFPPWREAIGNITCPILLITGDQEKGAMNTPDDVQEIAAFWKNGRVVSIEGTGHMIHFDQVERFVTAVKAFLVDIGDG